MTALMNKSEATGLFPSNSGGAARSFLCGLPRERCTANYGDPVVRFRDEPHFMMSVWLVRSPRLETWTMAVKLRDGVSMQSVDYKDRRRTIMRRLELGYPDPSQSQCLGILT